MKKIALMLALLLALTPVLVACGDDAAVTGEAASVAPEQNESVFSLDYLPELDFNEQSFGIYTDKGGARYLISEEETGDLVGDAIFQRNIAIEEKYNLKFNMVESDMNHPNDRIKNYIMSDDKTYHMYVNVTTAPMMRMVLGGYFVDWNNLEYVDYTQPYWNSRVATDINYGGRVYNMGGDLNLATYNNTNCIFFNKDLFDDLGIDYPYQDVYDYTWTIDKFINITRNGYLDLNGNSEWDREGDRFGFTGWGKEQTTALYVGMGGKPIINDEDNLPMLNLNNEMTVKIYDKIIELFDNVNAYSELDSYETIANLMRSGRVLMADRFISNLSINRDCDYQFGIVPYPMLDEKQGDYYSRAAEFAHLCYVPTTNTLLDETSIILEAMSIESYNNIRPIYYDITLSIKEAPDQETIEMVDLVLDTSTYIYDGFFNATTLKSMIINQTSTFTSWYASNESMFKSNLKKMLDFYA